MYKTLFIIFLCLAGIANGEPEEVDLGEYRVYFDLGINKSEYEMEIADPIYSETLGGEERIERNINIAEKENDDFEIGVASIRIFKIKNTELKINQEDQREGIYELIGKGIEVYDVYTDHRSIDGKDGIIAEAKMGLKSPVYGKTPFNGYFASYLENNETLVTVFSSYGWDSGTLSLLKSLRVEEN